MASRKGVWVIRVKFQCIDKNVDSIFNFIVQFDSQIFFPMEHMDLLEYLQVVAVAARDIKRAEEFAKKLGIPKAYGCYEDLARDRDIGITCWNYDYMCIPKKMHCKQQQIYYI